MLTLDAWLERPNPLLRIVDSRSRRVVAEWRGDDLQALLDSGTLAPADCCGPRSREVEQETIRKLILEACLEGITVRRRTHKPRCPQPARPIPQGHASNDQAAPTITPSDARNLKMIVSTRTRAEQKSPRPAAAGGGSLRLAFRRNSRRNQ
jgi:hypothetical protein